MNQELLTTREVAQLLGVGPTSVKRWADEGVLACVRTPGGHRRIPRQAVHDFMERTHAAEPRGAHTAHWIKLLGRGYDFAQIDDELARLRTQQGSWAHVADHLGPVLDEIGRRWQLGQLSVLEEHVASMRLARALGRCAEHLVGPEPRGEALLLTAPGEDHTLGLSLAEVCLVELGYRCVWVGRRTPTEDVLRYLGAGKAQLVAVSASAYATDTTVLEEFVRVLAPPCRQHGTRLLLGGTGLWPDHPEFGQRVRGFVELTRLLGGVPIAVTPRDARR